MGDDPKPRNESKTTTSKKFEPGRTPLAAMLRQQRAEETRDRVSFQLAPTEVMILLGEGTADEILPYAVFGRWRNTGRVVVSGYIRKRLADVGVPVSAIPKAELVQITSRLEKLAKDSRTLIYQYIREELDPFVKRMAGTYKITSEDVELIPKEVVEETTFWKLHYFHMPDELANYVEDRLRTLGAGELEATTLADKIIAYFENPDRYPSPPADRKQVDLLIDLLLSTNAATFNLVASPGSNPPKLWANRDPKEFPTAEAFLTKVYEGRLGIDGDLTLAALGRLDPPLLNALNIEFRGEERRAELHELLPTLKKRNDAKLKRELGYVPEGKERQSALAVMARGERPRARSALTR